MQVRPLALALATVVVLAPGSVLAQAASPPVLVELPTAEAPAGEPARVVRVLVRVGADGRAQVESCGESRAACEAIATAVTSGRFTPARVAGAPVAARIGVEVELRDTSPSDGAEELPSDSARGAPAAAARYDDLEAEAPVLNVSAEVTRAEGGARLLSIEEARETPGTLGDPLRAVLTMPGVVPPLDGVPYFYLRGAPPSGTTYDYDGIPMPLLYHFAGGPAVVHPRMLGGLQVHSGIAPARYGPHQGGVVAAAPPETLESAVGEVELRLLDLSGFVHVPYDRGSVSAAARIGYPGLIVSLFASGTNLQYYDYQVRARHALDASTSLEVVGLGSFDIWELSSDVEDEATGDVRRELLLRVLLNVQRAEVRLRSRRGPHHLLAAVLVGYEESALLTDAAQGEVGVRATRFGPRVQYELREPALRLRLGGHATAVLGGLTGSLERVGIPADLAPQLPSTELASQAAQQRMVGAVFGELELEPWRGLHVDLGIRAGGWMRPNGFEASVDPRLRVRWRVMPGWILHAAAGVARQPATFFYPLPGLTDLPLERGLQTAMQSEIGVTTEQRWDDGAIEIDLRLFLNRFEDTLFADLSIGNPTACTPEGLCRELSVETRHDGWSYGGELWARASFGRHLAARLAYTLARVETDALGPGVSYTPAYDVRHVWTLVLGWDSRDGWSAGLTGFLRSGAIDGFVYATDQLELGRYEQRLPWFGRVDASVAYGWNAGWAHLRVGLDFRNVTFAFGGEPLGIDCSRDGLAPSGPPTEACPVLHLPPIAAGTLGLRGTFR